MEKYGRGSGGDCKYLHVPKNQGVTKQKMSSNLEGEQISRDLMCLDGRSRFYPVSDRKSMEDFQLCGKMFRKIAL